MGLFKKLSSCKPDCGCNKTIVMNQKSYHQPLPNPNPTVFHIKRKFVSKNGRVVILVNYPHCTNFEGNKIIVLSSKNYLHRIMKDKFLDPHFCRDNGIIARFRPDLWKTACKFAEQDIV